MHNNNNYAMPHNSNLNYAQYKPSCMCYKVINYHDASWFLIAGGHPLPLICSATYGCQIFGNL